MPEESAAQKVQRELSACSYTNWYKDYEKVSIESTVLPIPANVLQYLLDEIIILPKECTPPAPLIGGGQQIESNAGYEDEDTEETEAGADKTSYKLIIIIKIDYFALYHFIAT